MLEAELDRHRDHTATAHGPLSFWRQPASNDLRITKGKLVRIDRAAIQAAAKYDGKWVLETNDDTISLEGRRLRL